MGSCTTNNAEYRIYIKKDDHQNLSPLALEVSTFLIRSSSHCA